MKIIIIKLILLISIFPLFATANVVSIGTGQQGSLGYTTGQAVAKVLNLRAKIRARIQPMAGTTAYLAMVSQGEFDFGFVNAVEAEYALKGIGNFENRPYPNLRMIGVMFPLRTGLATKASNNIYTMEDLKKNSHNLRIASEYSADTIINYYIMGALSNGDMTLSDFKTIPVSNLVKGMEALGENSVDVTLISLNSAAGKKVNAELSRDGGIQYISLNDDDESINKLKDYLPEGNVIKMEKDENIPGLQKAANIVEIPWVLVTNKDTDEELVYRVTKAIAENNEELKKAMGAFGRSDIKKMASVSGVEYHPGALKYYNEANIPVSSPE